MDIQSKTKYNIINVPRKYLTTEAILKIYKALHEQSRRETAKIGILGPVLGRYGWLMEKD